MVALSGWRKWLGLGPSSAELSERHRREEREMLLEVLREERQAGLKLQQLAATSQQETLKALATSSASFADYFKTIVEAGKPSVRVMDDAAEIASERARATQRERMEMGLRGVETLDVPAGLHTPATPDDLQRLLMDLRVDLTGDL